LEEIKNAVTILKSLGFEKSQVFYLGRGDKEECTKLNTYEVFYYQAGIERYRKDFRKAKLSCLKARPFEIKINFF
jgi:hypothetical protein